MDVERLAQELARYLKISTEDAEYLSCHVTRRDEIIAELYRHPDVKPSIAADNFVPPDGDPDVHLVPANAEIERLTPPKTLEEYVPFLLYRALWLFYSLHALSRVRRFHLAMAATMVFNQFKVYYALLDYPDLEMQVQIRKERMYVLRIIFSSAFLL